MASLTLAEVNAAIKALIDNPQVDYREGDVDIKAGQKLQQLLAVRKALIENPDAEMSTMAFDYDVSEFGEDLSQVER